MPSLLELAGYTWFVPNCALGVFFEFRDYKNLIERKGDYSAVPHTVLPSLRTLVEAIMCTGFFLFFNNYFWVEYIYSNEFTKDSFFMKMVYIYVIMTVKRFFYYGPFKFTTGAFIASGLGYCGPNSKPGKQWDRVVGVYVLDVELAMSATTMLRAWNHQVHLWLKYYIQDRIQRGSRPTFLESMSTFVVSAFWHGFYPSYYIMFVLAAILNEINKDIYKSWFIFKSFMPIYAIRYLAAHVLSFIAMNYFGILFQALTVERTMWYLKETLYGVPIGLVSLLIFVRAINLVKISKKMEEKQLKKQD